MNKPIVSEHVASKGSEKSYITGFLLSLGLTLVAFFAVTEKIAEGWGLVLLLSGLAVTQLLVQLVYFLHIGQEEKPRWNLHSLLFASMVVVIIVFGSLWIMRNLMYGHHEASSSSEIIKDEGYKP